VKLYYKRGDFDKKRKEAVISERAVSSQRGWELRSQTRVVINQQLAVSIQREQ
jgi:hypothetical protein